MKPKQATLVRYLFPRLQDVLFISLLAVVILYGPRLFNQDGDLGRHITIGRYILDNWKIPLYDIFSSTMPGAPLVPHEWLAQVFFALAYRIMGLNGDVLLTALIIAGTFLLAYRTSVQRPTFRLVSLVAVLWAAAASSLHWLARPHVFTFLLLALWTYQLERVPVSDTRRLWPFPVIMLIWANTHGAFIAGFVVLGFHFLEWGIETQRRRALKNTGSQLAIIGLTSLLATLLNPSGWRIWTTSLGYIGNDYLVGHTVEYFSPDFHNYVTWPFLLMLAFSLTALAWGKQLRLRDGMLLGAWAAMGLYSARNIPLFAIICAPILADLLQAEARRSGWIVEHEAELERLEKRLAGFLWPSAAVIVVAALFMLNMPLDLTRQGNHFDPSVFPVQATDWLEAHPQQGNSFNAFTWGGYLLYRGWPQQKVFIDGQTDFYGERLTREYETAITLAPGWSGVLEKYHVAWAVVPYDWELAHALQDHGWKVLYKDTTAVVLRKPE